MKPIILVLILVSTVSFSGCSESETPAAKGPAKTPEAAAREPISTVASLTVEVSRLAKEREEATTRYREAVSAYEAIRDELIAKRVDLAEAEKRNDEEAVGVLSVDLSSLTKLEAAAVAAHKRLLKLTVDFQAKSMDLITLRGTKPDLPATATE